MTDKRSKSPEERDVSANPDDPAQFTHDFRLQTISLREIVVPLKRAALEIGSYRDRDGREHVLTPGTLLNALVLGFVELPPAERERVALAAVGRLEAFRDSLRDPDAAADAGGPAPAPARRVGRSPARRDGRRKSG